MFKIIKKADIILFILLIILGLGLSYTAASGGHEPGNKVVVTLDGKLYDSYNLSEDQVIEISGGSHINKILIKSGTVEMVEADCHNQLCVKQGPISNVGESIVCLPNRVVVSITADESDGEEADVDAISG